MEFDGTGDWLVLPDSENYAFNTGNFTIEGWGYISNTSGVKVLFDSRITNNSNGIAIYTNGSTINVANGGSGLITNVGTLTANTWFHVAFVRSGTGSNQSVLYLNGTSVGTATLSTSFAVTKAFVGNSYLNEYWNGFIDDLRITKGIARYTSNFTAPTKSHKLK
jgi:hypothetical protein